MLASSPIRLRTPAAHSQDGRNGLATSGHDVCADVVLPRAWPFKKIRLAEVTDQIPKGASGKILRRVLVEQETARSAATLS
jgi:acyl-coenzyme A synthetase/AMP-(fatty) acid ligase